MNNYKVSFPERMFQAEDENHAVEQYLDSIGVDVLTLKDTLPNIRALAFVEDYGRYHPNDYTACSSSSYSHDMQVDDAMSVLKYHFPKAYTKVLKEFPEFNNLIWNRSSIDTVAMNVDQDWVSWLTDAIETTGYIFWEDGEPYAYDMEEM